MFPVMSMVKFDVKFAEVEHVTLLVHMTVPE